MGALFFQFLVHPIVQTKHIFFRIVAARHARLVRDDDGQDAALVEAADGGGSIGRPDEILRTMQVMNIDVQRAVTVKEYSGDALILHSGSSLRPQGSRRIP